MKLRDADLTWHLAGDEVVVLDLKGSVYLKLNGSGRLLWEKLAESSDVATLEGALIDQYSIDADQASADVEAFLTDLRQRGLLAE